MQKYFIALLSIILIACSKDGNLDATKLTNDVEGFYSNGVTSGATVQPGQLTAGEWCDLERWGFWLELMNNQTWTEKQAYWNFYTLKRFSVSLTDNQNLNIPNATVTLKSGNNHVLYTAKTDNAGKAELFQQLFASGDSAQSIEIEYQNQVFDYENIIPFTTGVNNFTLPLQRTLNNLIDIVFVIDATGSMGDEMNYLKAELADVISRIQQNNNTLQMRLGLVFYRDLGDDYVTKNYPLTENLQSILSILDENDANGGNDYPEAIDSAYNQAINQQPWNNEALTRIIFHVCDAPPHHESIVIDAIQQQVKLAAQKGIKIIPVGASGINKDTEFLLRFIAIATNGTYVFLTNNSGIGGEHIEATVGLFTVEYLNDLLVRLVLKNTSLLK